MQKLTTIVLLIFSLVLIFNNNSFACSLIKITENGITIVGNNEDFSNPDVRIWFEPGLKNEYGVMYVGYDNLFPEGGINEAGLVCDAFGLPAKPVKDTLGKAPIFELDLKRMIMKTCSTVEQVKNLISKYNLYYWFHGIWMFIDSKGNYLSVDGNLHTLGNNKYYVQTNFRPSEITRPEDITCWRYKKAMSLLDKKAKADMKYVTALMDSIHQEGTLYTTVYDTKNCKIDLYYNHNYSKCITLNLKDELKKGKRVLSIPELFPGQITSNFKGYKNLKATMDSLITLDVEKDSAIRDRIKAALLKLPYTIHVLGNYGYECLHQDSIAHAMALFKVVIELFPDLPDGYDFLGEAYMQTGQYKTALDYYQLSLQKDADNVNARQRIAVLVREM